VFDGRSDDWLAGTVRVQDFPASENRESWARQPGAESASRKGSEKQVTHRMFLTKKSERGQKDGPMIPIQDWKT
jgi:hypothetical protein